MDHCWVYADFCWFTSENPLVEKDTFGDLRKLFNILNSETILESCPECRNRCEQTSVDIFTIQSLEIKRLGNTFTSVADDVEH